MDMKALIKNEFKGWKFWEVAWLTLASVVITGLSIYWGDNLIGIISALTGVICVILTGKGKLGAYLFGLINCVLYAIIAYKATLIGETMLNLIFYVPMQFVGFYIWKKNMNSKTNEVIKKKMSWKNRIIWTLLLAVATAGYGVALQKLGDAQPYLDSFTTVTSVFAMIISIKMYAEQWIIWVVVDIASVIMWIIAFASGNDSIATLLMWIIYLGNAIIMCVKWFAEAYRKETTDEI